MLASSAQVLAVQRCQSFNGAQPLTEAACDQTAVRRSDHASPCPCHAVEQCAAPIQPKPVQGLFAPGPSGAMSGSEDELDALLQHYEQQAAADVAAVQRQVARSGPRKRQKVSSADKREAALSQPLGADNK